MGRWLFAVTGTLALAVLLVGALIGGTPGPAPASPPATTTTPAAAGPSATPTPSPSATAAPGEPIIVWLARDALPPIAIRAAASPMREATAETRIAARLGILSQLQPREVPAGAGNELAASRTKPTVRQVRVEGDVAHVDWNVPNGDWGAGGSAGQLGLLQQLVYTATEEPGIRRVMLTENGGRPTTPMAGHGLPLDKPLAREDVSGYQPGGTDAAPVTYRGMVAMEIVSTRVVNEMVPGLGRFTVELGVRGGGSAGPGVIPSLVVKISDSGSMRVLRVDLPDAADPSPKIPYEEFASGPIRWIDSPHTRGPTDTGAIFLLGLDDARPWRVTVEPTGTGMTRVNVDVGGRPQWVNRSLAVYALDPHVPTRGAIVSGAARVFEANVAWRTRDANGRVLARGSTTATLGTSAVWGTFSVPIEGGGPAPCPRAGSIEIFWISPRDGTEQDLIAIPFAGAC